MNIDYNLYKIFLYLFEEKSISKTANKLYVSQPAISYSLKELESQLGYTLFNRNSKGIEPTTEAKELYRYVSAAFSILNEAEEHIKNLNNLNVGCIRIGISDNLPAMYSTEIITKFRDLYSGIKFEIINEKSRDLLEKLEMRKLDLVFDVLPISVKDDFVKEALDSFQNCFVYNKELKINIDDIGELKNYTLILPDNNTVSRNRLDEYLKNRNIVLESNIEVSSVEMILELVNKSIGIGYLPKKVALDQPELEIIEFTDLPTMDICLIYHDDYLSVAAKKFIELLMDRK